MKFTRRRILALSALLGFPKFVLSARHENLALASIHAAARELYGDKELVNSNDIDLAIASKEPMANKEEVMFLAEDPNRVNFTIKIDNLKYDSILVLLQNPNTYDVQLVSKYDVEESFSHYVGGRLKLSCNQSPCNVYALVNGESEIFYTNKLVFSWGGCVF